MRDHLQEAANQGSERATGLLEERDIPEAVEYLRAWFAELDSGRRFGTDGPERLTWVDFEAWERMMGMDTTPEEIRALMRVDTAFLYGGEDWQADG